MIAADGRIITKLVDGQQTENLEELNLLTPGLCWSPDGKTLALATKAGAEAAIIRIDAETRNYGKLTFGLEGIFSIAWSPKGDKIAFSGAVARQSDIFMVDTKTGVLTNLSDDIFSDFQPAWTPDGSALVFSSDRGVHVRPIEAAVDTLEYNQTDLYRIDVGTQAVTRLTDWPNSDESTPVVSPDGKKMIFVSDRNGITNM